MDELLGRQMPYSAEAEQAVLGSMMIDPACVPEVLQNLREEEFYIEANRDIFGTISHMFSFGMTVDPVTVLDQMKTLGVLREGSNAYILELMEATPTSANVMKYVEIVRDRALLRSVAGVASDISNLVFEGDGTAENVLELSEQKIYALRKGRSIGGLEKISSIVLDVYDQISALSESGGGIPGLSTGLIDLDSYILGLNKGELVLIASRPGMGKTSIALNIALHVGKTTGKTVAIFSLEMSRSQLVTRLLSSESLVNSQKLLTGKLSAGEWQRIGVACSSLAQTDLRIDDNSTLSVADMRAQCRRLDNLGLVVIDYLQLMQSAGTGGNHYGESRQQAVSDISRMLKIMSKELNVPIVCLSQLSRASEGRQNKRPMLSDLRESGAIEQDADIVIGLYREGYYNDECENPNEAEAIVLKNRHGNTGTVRLTWLPEYTTYANAARGGESDEY